MLALAWWLGNLVWAALAWALVVIDYLYKFVALVWVIRSLRKRAAMAKGE